MEQQCEVNEIKEIREANATNSIEEWLQLLQDADNSDMTRKQWCEANGISLRRFYYWQQKFREHDQPDDIAEENGGSQVGTFCELQIPVARVGDGDNVPADHPDALILECGPFRLQIPQAFLVEVLKHA